MSAGTTSSLSFSLDLQAESARDTKSIENSDLIKFIISDQIGYIFIQIYIHEKVVQVQHQSLIVQISY